MSTQSVLIHAAAFTFLGLGACSTSGSPASSSPLTFQTFTSSDASNDVTSTLILGQQDAVLIDAQFVDSEATKLVNIIRASGRRLTTVYVTHAHPDHHFGLAVLRAAFPQVQVLAHPSVASEMKSTWQAKHDYWKSVYGADLTDVEVDATPYSQPTLALEQHELRLIGPGEGDLPNEVAVFVPDASLLVTGDTSYNGTHVWLADTTPSQWDAWLSNLQALQALHPTTVVSGHRDASRADSSGNLDATAEYISAFKAAVSAAHSANDVIATMTARYPSLKLPVILQLSAQAAFPAPVAGDAGADDGGQEAGGT